MVAVGAVAGGEAAGHIATWSQEAEQWVFN